MKSNRTKVGLLDCYTGGNFGDGAVQDAVINNLTSRISGCSISLITLSPDRTTEIHGVPSYPLNAAVYLSNHSKPNHQQSAPPISGADLPVIARLRQNPAARRLFFKPWRIAKRTFSFARILFAELRHILASWCFLRDFQLLIISGGGQLDDYWDGPMGHPYALLKWSLLAKTRAIPVVFLSVGVDRLERRLSHRFIRMALKFAVYRSYRDVGSKSMLANLPFTHTDLVTPDLAFSFDPDALLPDTNRTGSQDRLRIGISPIAYMLKDHWPRDNAGVFQPYFDALVAFTAELLEHGHEVALFATAAADNHIITMLLERLHHMLPPSQMSGLRRITARSARDLVPEISRLDSVVASRLHGVILSHLAKKPVLAISYDRKVTQHMRDMNQASCCLDIHCVRVSDLREAFTHLSAEIPAIRTMLGEKAIAFRGLLARQYDGIALLSRR